MKEKKKKKRSAEDHTVISDVVKRVREVEVEAKQVAPFDLSKVKDMQARELAKAFYELRLKNTIVSESVKQKMINRLYLNSAELSAEKLLEYVERLDKLGHRESTRLFGDGDSKGKDSGQQAGGLGGALNIIFEGLGADAVNPNALGSSINPKVFPQLDQLFAAAETIIADNLSKRKAIPAKSKDVKKKK